MIPIKYEMQLKGRVSLGTNDLIATLITISKEPKNYQSNFEKVAASIIKAPEASLAHWTAQEKCYIS